VFHQEIIRLRLALVGKPFLAQTQQPAVLVAQQALLALTLLEVSVLVALLAVLGGPGEVAQEQLLPQTTMVVLMEAAQVELVLA
jgi:hypothetical protein